MTFLSFGKVKAYNPFCCNKSKGYFETIKDFVKEWNDTFPFDRHFREEYKIPIFSEAHLDTSFFTMLCWWQEWELFNKKEEPPKDADADIGMDFLKQREALLKKKAGL